MRYINYDRDSCLRLEYYHKQISSRNPEYYRDVKCSEKYLSTNIYIKKRKMFKIIVIIGNQSHRRYIEVMKEYNGT